MHARPRSVYHDSRYFLLHDQAVAEIEAQVELGESAFEVERMVSLRQWLEHYTRAVSDLEVPSRLPAMTIKQRQLHNASASPDRTLVRITDSVVLTMFPSERWSGLDPILFTLK